MLPSSMEELLERMESGETFQFHLFYEHTPFDNGAVTNACFSQWFVRPFEIDGVSYQTAEHWMMAEKARLFGDEEMLAAILETPKPRAAKKFGRQVKSFEKEKWDEHAEKIVFKGNFEKFQQHPDLREFLLSTEQTVLVEAAVNDSIWGIGIGTHDDEALDPLKWKGLNKLGFVLTQVREALARKS